MIETREGSAGSSWRPSTLGLATIGAIALFLVLAAPHWEHLVDDAYISFRYARHLIEGHGLVFNVGERVEGYTNFLWTMLVAAAMRVGLSPESAARIAGTAASIGLLAVYPRYVRRWTGSTPAASLAPVLLACCLPFCVWATAGLETPLFALLLLLGVGQASSARAKGDARALALASAALALSGLARPEGVLFLGVIVGAVVLSPGRLSRRHALATAAAVSAALLLPHAIWRLATYGSLVPNTYAAKVGFDEVGLALVPRGLDYLRRFVLELKAWALLPLVGFVVGGRSPGASRAAEGLGLPLLVLLCGLGATVLVGGDGLTAFRFLVPLLPFLLAAVASGAARLAARGRSRTRPALFIALAALALSGLLVPHTGGDILRAVRAETHEVHAWRVMGAWFREHTAPDATLAVVVAGAIPYVSERPAIDLLGLTDATIARTPVSDPGHAQAGHERSNVEYVLSRAPEYVVVGEYALHPRVDVNDPALMLFYRAERELVASPRFRERYEPRAARTPEGFFITFARRDVPPPPSTDRPATR